MINSIKFECFSYGKAYHKLQGMQILQDMFNSSALQHVLEVGEILCLACSLTAFQLNNTVLAGIANVSVKQDLCCFRKAGRADVKVHLLEKQRKGSTAFRLSQSLHPSQTWAFLINSQSMKLPARMA